MNDNLTPSDIGNAEDALLRNPDALQDWIGDACMNKAELPWLPQLREIDPDVMSTAALLSFALDRGQRRETRLEAMSELADRFLRDNNDAVLMRAGEFADERIADATELLREERAAA